jgi:hypothetical protein
MHPDNDHVREGPIRLTEDGGEWLTLDHLHPDPLLGRLRERGDIGLDFRARLGHAAGHDLRRQAALYHGQHCEVAIGLSGKARGASQRNSGPRCQVRRQQEILGPGLHRANINCGRSPNIDAGQGHDRRSARCKTSSHVRRP